MGLITNIEWSDSSVNPTDFQCDGCELWQPSLGKKKCYAGRFAERIRGIGAFDQPIQLKPGRMAQAAAWSDLRGKAHPGKPWINPDMPRIIFIGDMADTFSRGVPFEYLRDEVIANVTSPSGRRHVWMWLTKQAKRLAKFADWLKEQNIAWPDNLWPGVSVTSNTTLWRVDHLLKVPSDHRFISYGPAWEWVDFSPYFCKGYKDEEGFSGVDPTYAIALVIIEGESGPDATPFNLAWAKQLIDDCEEDRVECFVKQVGSRAICDNANLFEFPDEAVLLAEGEGAASCRFVTKDKKGGDWTEWPDEIRVRNLPSPA